MECPQIIGIGPSKLIRSPPITLYCDMIPPVSRVIMTGSMVYRPFMAAHAVIKFKIHQWRPEVI